MLPPRPLVKRHFKDSFQSENITVFPYRAISLVDKEIKLENGENVNFSRLLLCTGARPRRPPDIDSKFVYTLRDAKSAKILSEKVQNSKKIVLVGNGGIGKSFMQIVLFENLPVRILSEFAVSLFY